LLDLIRSYNHEQNSWDKLAFSGTFVNSHMPKLTHPTNNVGHLYPVGKGLFYDGTPNITEKKMNTALSCITYCITLPRAFVHWSKRG